MNSKIYLSSPHMSDEGYEKEFINQAFESNWIAPLGENVDKFEEELGHLAGDNENVAVLSSGSAALHLALLAAGVKQGDIVFCQSLTFIATANPILYVGATPVFIDSNENNWNMSVEGLKKAFIKYPNAKCVIVVNLYGIASNLDEIKKVCTDNNAILIEDAAESLGTKYQGKSTGTFGDYGIYSFNGNKIITTSGGGALISKNKEGIKKARFWATQARDQARHYQHTEIGYNYRMSNVVAGIGRGQLKVLNERVEKKRYIYNFYKNGLSSITDITFMPIDSEGEYSNCWLTCIRLDPKSKVKPLDIILALESKNIESRPIWKPLHLQPLFKDADYIDNGSIAEIIFNEGLCLPSDTKLTDEQLVMIIEIIKNLWC